MSSSRCRSSPLGPGRRTSSTRHPGESARGLLRNACALGKACTASPTERKSLLSESRTDWSSSTTKMIGSVDSIQLDDTTQAPRRGRGRGGAIVAEAMSQEEPGAVHARLHGGQFDLKRLGDLGVREALDVMQQERGALVTRQEVDGRAEHRVEFGQ